MLAFNCPACKHYGEADNAMAGEIIGCANCLAHFRLPEIQDQVPDAPKEAPRISVKEPGRGAVVEAWARCTLCGARRLAHDRCTFCGYEFRSADAIEVDASRRYRRQVGLQLLAVLALGGALIGVPSGAFYLKTANDDEKRVCNENLMIFHQAVMLADRKAPGVPSYLGRQFLIAISQREGVSHALLCPAVNRGSTLRAIDYRGPARPWADLGPEDPLVADLEGNHRGVTVLLKNGQVEYASRGSALYKRALEGTKE